MNPLALVLVALGALCAFFGWFGLRARNRRGAIIVVGLGVLFAATPYAISFFLANLP